MTLTPREHVLRAIGLVVAAAFALCARPAREDELDCGDGVDRDAEIRRLTRANGAPVNKGEER